MGNVSASNESPLARAVREKNWEIVMYMLKSTEFSNTKEQDDAVEAFVRHASLEMSAGCCALNQYYLDIWSFCNVNHFDIMLERFVNSKEWEHVLNLLNKKKVSEYQERWAVSQLIQKMPVVPSTSEKDESLWYLRRVSREKDISVRYSDILQYCTEHDIDAFLARALKEGGWFIVGKILEKGVSEAQFFEILDKADANNDAAYSSYVIPFCSKQELPYFLGRFVTEGMWKSVVVAVENEIPSDQLDWVVREASERASDEHLISILRRNVTGKLDTCVAHLLSNKRLAVLVHLLLDRAADFIFYTIYHDTMPVADLFYKDIRKKQWMTAVGAIDQNGSHVIPQERFWLVVDNLCVGLPTAKDLLQMILKQRKTFVDRMMKLSSIQGNAFLILNQKNCESISIVVEFILCCLLFRDSDNGCSSKISAETVSEIYDTVMKTSLELVGSVTYCTDMDLVQTFIQHFLGSSKKSHTFNLHFMSKLAKYPLISETQCLALTIMLKKHKWHVISNARLACVWESLRRDLFRGAVEQKLWATVKKWADHTLYNDLRWWALEEAYKAQQWEVMLCLADHGLSEIELMRVRNRLAKYGDWEVVLQMFDRGAGVAEVKEVVERSIFDRRQVKNANWNKQTLLDRLRQLYKLENHLDACKRKIRSSKDVSTCRWMYTWHSMTRMTNNTFFNQVLKTAAAAKDWHIVIQLVRLGISDAQRDFLFTSMLKRRQWGVCLALLEQGVSVQLCLDALPELMDRGQWTLVARVMEYDVGDSVRRQVMHRALDRREGSVVWLCMDNMQQLSLSPYERQELFQVANSHDDWQVMKLLIQEKDELGLAHRDAAFFAGVKHRQWDLVDFCQFHGVDVDIKAKNKRETQMQIAATEKDWKCVDELLVRGGDPNVLDENRSNTLRRATEDEQWDTVKLAIEFLGDIHRRFSFSPESTLQLLINAYQGDLIHHTLMWCPNQADGINDKDETTLHAVAISGRPEHLYYQIARGVDPLALTKNGQSVLLYSVKNETCPQAMVAECIQLGLSTWQPILTVSFDVSREVWNDAKRIKSPFYFAIGRGLPAVALMLYESGAVSYRELFMLNQCLSSLTRLTVINEFLPRLKIMATTPRSLKSSCRLVISHCLKVKGKGRRYRAVQQLKYLDKDMKNYVMFSDLTDPKYGQGIAARKQTVFNPLAILNGDFFVHMTDRFFPTFLVYK